MTCPYFSPTERADNLSLPHPARLPLGGSWRGVCCAPSHELSVLSDSELESCNLGYAKTCPRLPEIRNADAVRFAVIRESQDCILLQFVLELAHLPADHGSLEYDRRLRIWAKPHPEPRIQAQAEAFLDTYLQKVNFKLHVSD